MRKTLISIAFAALAFTSCKKEGGITPKDDTAPTKPGLTAKLTQDTIPDNAALKVLLAKDSLNRDETLILFDHTASMDYSKLTDALYLPGFGKVSLCSVSHDDKNVAIYTLPYKTGMSIHLNVNAKADGDYSLSLSAKKQLPENLHVWIKDKYAKDSLDVNSGNYDFKVVKADSNSFGNKRFSLVFKQVRPK